MKKIKTIINYLFILIVFFVMFSANWLLTSYGDITVDELLFHIFVPIKATEKGLIYSFILKSAIPTFILTNIVFIILTCTITEIKKYNFFELIIRFKKRQITFNIKKNLILFMLFLTEILVATCILYISMNKIQIFEYIKNQNTNSSFIKDNFVDSKRTNIVFPDKKKNLIYIYVESLESTYL